MSEIQAEKSSTPMLGQAPSYLLGDLLVLEGGEEDTTIHPSPLSLHVQHDTRPDVSADVQEFQATLEKYKDEQVRPLPTWSEVFQLLHSLGYRKESAPAKSPQPADGAPARSATIQRETTE